MNDSETIQVAFHATARVRYFALVDDFFAQAGPLDRSRDEHRYRELCGHYVHTLRHDLEEVAQALLHEHQHNPQIGSIDQNLQQGINEYMHEFVQKTR